MIYRARIKYRTAYGSQTRDRYYEAQYETEALKQALSQFESHYCYIYSMHIQSLEDLDKESKAWKQWAIFFGTVVLSLGIAFIIGGLLG